MGRSYRDSVYNYTLCYCCTLFSSMVTGRSWNQRTTLADYLDQHYHHNWCYYWLLSSLCSSYLFGCPHFYIRDTWSCYLYQLSSVFISAKMASCDHFQNSDFLVSYSGTHKSDSRFRAVSWLVVWWRKYIYQ